MKAEQFTAPITYHGEGAIWSASWGGLKCVDMLAGDVLSIGGDGTLLDRLHVGSPIAAMLRPRASGGFVVATERGFAAFAEGSSGAAGSAPEWTSPELWRGPDTDGASSALTPATAAFPIIGTPIRMNEGGCTPDGAVLCGTMAYDQTPGAASMWRMAPDRTMTRLFGGLTVSNGLGFTADGALMYYADTHTHRIDVFDYIDGELRDRRPFATIDGPAGGRPDGLCVDAEGGVWTALYGGSAVRHYDASGRLADVIEVGAHKVTSCTLGGDDLSTLYITTSREDVEPGEDPLAGSLFAAAAGVRGMQPLAFAG
jgi:sugar lactone lactonase YvrE